MIGLHKGSIDGSGPASPEPVPGSVCPPKHGSGPLPPSAVVLLFCGSSIGPQLLLRENGLVQITSPLVFPTSTVGLAPPTTLILMLQFPLRKLHCAAAPPRYAVHVAPAFVAGWIPGAKSAATA